jgi:hypothetical protein
MATLKDALGVGLEAVNCAERAFKERLARAGNPAAGGLRRAFHDAVPQICRVHAGDGCGRRAHRAKTRVPRCFSSGHQRAYQEDEQKRAPGGGGVRCLGHWCFGCNYWLQLEIKRER